MLVAVFCLTSCSGLLFIPKDRPVLIENIVQVNGENTRSDEDYDIMRQRANRSIGNVRLFLSMYQWGDRIGENWVGRGLKNIGEAPTFYDSIERIKTADQLRLHYFNQGYYNAQVSSTPIVKRRRAKVVYQVVTGKGYRAKEYAIFSTSRYMDRILQEYPTTFFTRDLINAEALENERIAINNFLKDQGYYEAKLGWTYFEIDTAAGPSQSTVTCVVDPFIYGAPLEQKVISKIRVQPTYSYKGATAGLDSTRTLHGMDVRQTSKKFRPGFIDHQIFLERGQLYSLSDLRGSYKNLSELNLFQNVELNIVPNDSALTADVKLVPLPKRAVTASLEGLGNNGSLGIGGNLSWDNRNMFRGGELLRITIGGSLTDQRNSNNSSWLFDARELNTSVSLRLPKLLLPRKWAPKNSRKWAPKTTFNSRISYQFRANEFNRFNYTSGVEYSWRIGKAVHRLSPYSISLVQIDLNAPTTPFLFVGFQDLVFSASKYSFSDSWQFGRDRFFLALEAESGGHLLRRIGVNDLAGVPLAPYVKSTVDFRYYHRMVRNRQLAFRTMAGLSSARNTPGGFVPFEKSFFMGGANDLRGWTAYHFGPGATSTTVLQTQGYFSAAPIKLLASAEYRYTIQEAIKGAVFLDAGNIWLHNRTYSGTLTTAQQEAIASGIFRPGTFLSQLGVNTGFGLRYDLEFLILRADLGIKIHHPGAVDRSNWVITDPVLRDLNLNLGIGYPF